MADEIKKSKVELIKESSAHLRGTIAENLKEETASFPEDQTQLLKFHGIYQQDNRDTRKERMRAKLEREYSLMIRSRFPGGVLSAEQYLMYNALCREYSNGTLRITTRQTFQLHGVLKKNIKATVAKINQSLITSLGACGDVVRNVMASPLPTTDRVRTDILSYAKRLSDKFLPQTAAYHEIWLDGEKVSTVPALEEPLYGANYLPRKFKIGIAFGDDNSVDVYTQDIGIVPIVESNTLAGFNVLVGGGLGFTHRMQKTYPRLASPLCFVRPEQLEGLCEQIIRLQRDHGGRSDRKRARLKYLIDDWGLEKFKAELAKRYQENVDDPRPMKWTLSDFPKYHGWHLTGDKEGYYGLSIENGRIKDTETFQLKTAIAKIVEKYKPKIRLTPYQDILFCHLPLEAEKGIAGILKEHRVKASGEISMVRKMSMACPALPTCGLALGESERVLPDLIDQIEAKLKELDLADLMVSVRMTGCPNSCARPETSEIAFIATQPQMYNIYIGGAPCGDRMNSLYKERVPFDEIISVLAPLFEQYRSERKEGESFGDFSYRTYIGSQK